MPRFKLLSQALKQFWGLTLADCPNGDNFTQIVRFAWNFSELSPIVLKNTLK